MVQLRRVALMGLRLAALALGIATLMALLGPWNRLADALSHFHLHFAAAGLGLALAASLAHKPLAAAGVALCALNAVAALGYPYAAPEPSRGGRPLRVLTLNTLKTAENTDRIAARIRAEAADFVVLQEVTAAKIDIVDRLAAEYPWRIDCRAHWQCDVAILSRHPWLEAEVLKLGAKLAVARFGPELGNLTLASVHLNWPLISDQRAQLEQVRAHLQRWAAGPIVLAGDFNALPWSGVLGAFTRQSGLLPAGPYTPTWPRRGFVSGRPVCCVFPSCRSTRYW